MRRRKQKKNNPRQRLGQGDVIDFRGNPNENKGREIRTNCRLFGLLHLFFRGHVKVNSTCSQLWDLLGENSVMSKTNSFLWVLFVSKDFRWDYTVLWFRFWNAMPHGHAASEAQSMHPAVRGIKTAYQIVPEVARLFKSEIWPEL